MDAPPVTLLHPDLLRPALLERRLRFLRLMGWAWEEGAPVVTVLADRRIAGEAGALAAAVAPRVADGTVAVQLAAGGGPEGEEEVADAFEEALAGRCRRIPGVAALEDLAAVVSSSAAVLAPPGVGVALAAAFGVPAASPPDLAGALPALLAGRIRAVTAPPVAAPVESAEAGVRAAHRALGLRLFAERRAHQAALDAATAELETALAGSRAEAARLRSELEAARAANTRIVGSRTWRYTQPLRDARARIREGQR